MNPTLSELIGGYLVVWEDPHIEAKISRVHVHQDGHVTGMLAITHQNGEGPVRLLPNTQFNFSSDVTRSKQAKQLTDKYEFLHAPWPEVFDYLGEHIQEAALSGSPMIEVCADEDATAPPLLINPLIYQGHQNIIFGEKGVNKSTLCYALAMFLATPETTNPLGLTMGSQEPVLTAVLDWETDEPTFRWYTGKLAKGLERGPVPIYYRRCRLPLAQDIGPIADYLVKYGIKVIIIDSLGAAASGEGGELKSSQSALEFNAALRYLPGITSVIIGQTAKSQDTGRKSVYGSTFFQYYARNIFELCRGEDDESNVLHLGLFHRECNFSRKSKPIGIRVTYQDTGGISIEHEALSLDDFMEKVSISGKIEGLLKRGPMNRKDLVEQLQSDSISKNAIDVAINRMSKAKKVIQLPDKTWALPTKERD